MPAPDTQILSRVVMLQTADGAGAGFVVDRRKRKWLVTAAHVVPDDPVLELELIFATGRSPTGCAPRPDGCGGRRRSRCSRSMPPRSRFAATWSCRTPDCSWARTCTSSAIPLIGYGDWRTDTGGTLPFIRKGCMGGTMSQEGTRMLLDRRAQRGRHGRWPGHLRARPQRQAPRRRRDHRPGRRGQPNLGRLVPRFPLGITQVVSIDHVNETIDAWKGR